MNKNFELACRVLGWGDPDNGLWFVGMEEAGVWSSEQELTELAKRQSLQKRQVSGEPVFIDTVDPRKYVDYISGGRPQTQIRNMQSYIACPFSKSGPTSYVDYRDSKLWGNDSGVFQTNVFPLGKPKANQPLPKIYSELFGFGPEDTSAYIEATKSFRFPLIRDLRASSGPQAIICFGKSFWRFAGEIFEIDVKSIGHGKLAFFDEERIILTPFLGQGMSYNLADQIVAKLREWEVKLP